jgi:hypothetical protein
MLDVIELQSYQYNNGPRVNYSSPVKQGRVELADGIFLCDDIFGLAFGVCGKEVSTGVYESTSLPGHLMFEEPAPELKE